MPKRQNSPADEKTDSAARRKTETGNIFAIVMLAVFLFAALMFTFSRGAQQGTGNISDKQATLAATDIIAYAQKIERAVSRIYRRGISEDQINFENNIETGYANGNCGNDSCKIFHPDGGSVTWQSPPADANDGSEWLFAGNVQVAEVGTTNSNATSSELLALLPGLKADVCKKINESLNYDISGIPEDRDDIDRVKFTGTFSFTDSITGITGADLVCPPAVLCNVRAACIKEETGSQDYIFYSVLLGR